MEKPLVPQIFFGSERTYEVLHGLIYALRAQVKTLKARLSAIEKPSIAHIFFMNTSFPQIFRHFSNVT